MADDSPTAQRNKIGTALSGIRQVLPATSSAGHITRLFKGPTPQYTLQSTTAPRLSRHAPLSSRQGAATPPAPFSLLRTGAKESLSRTPPDNASRRRWHARRPTLVRLTCQPVGGNARPKSPRIDPHRINLQADAPPRPRPRPALTPSSPRGPQSPGRARRAPCRAAPSARASRPSRRAPSRAPPQSS
jgi:hypothetical protein